MSKIWRVEEEQVMKAGKITGTNYTVWYKDENGARTARRDYRHGHYKVIPMTVLNFILDENNEARTRYQEFDGNTYKRTTYQQPKESPQEAPAAEAEQQPTETENAHQAATQAAKGTDEKKEAETMTTTEREALERINARQNAENLFTNIGPEDIAAEIETMTDEQKEEEKPMSNTANDLQKYVDGIAADLRRLYEADQTDEEREAAEESGEAADLYSYFADVLDIEYTISSRGDYLGARIAVALGGPNIYIDTREGYVKGYWGTDRAERWIPSEICEEIDSIMEEYYNMVRGA